MSHVSTVDLEVRDLKALAEAAEKLGLELVEQKTYHWFGQHVGDYPLPEGFSEKDLGKCDLALRVKDGKKKPKPYEIGVVAKDGGYTLLYDFFQGGYGLMQKVSTDGQSLNLLKQEYATAVARRELQRKGFRVREVRENGKVRLIAQ